MSDTGTDSTSQDTGNSTDVRPTDTRVEQCSTQAQCDDGIACTDDACIVGGVCEHVTNDRLCAQGERCIVGRGCSSGTSCTTNAECNDQVDCTLDLCAAGGMCEHLRDDSRCTDTQVCSYTLDCVARGRCGIDADCDNGLFCDGQERCVQNSCMAGNPPDCRDSDPCTADLCDNMMGRCNHPAVTPCGGQVTPGTYRLAPSPMYRCDAGQFGPVAQITLSTTGGTTTITGFPVTLTGGAPSGGQFSTMGTWSNGTCQWVFSFSGSFMVANQFDGLWSVSFNNCSALLGCNGGSGVVVGTRQ